MMNDIFLHEPFDTATFDSRLNWYNPPARWQIHASCLVIESDAKTDYWQKTHYGFTPDSGHFLFVPVTGDLILTTMVRFHPVHQYDQAGLMVRISPQCWLKTSVEYEPHGPARLGVVVTNAGYSDWSTQNVSAQTAEMLLRVRREHSDYLVEYALPERQSAADIAIAWTQIRMAHLFEDDGARAVQCGIYACSPIDAGYVAEFEYLKIERGRV
jgi:uncharacterized protein